MSSTKTRQRKLERDRYERRMVRRAQGQRRRRRIQAGVGAFLALGVLVTGTAWLAGWFESAPEEPPAADRCSWQPQQDPERVDVGTPPANPPETGTRTVAIDLDAGDAGSGQVELEVSIDEDPCTAASLAYLAEEGFYDDTVCHELTAEGALRCGDPTGNSLGGPSYQYFGSNYPRLEPVATDTPEPGGTPEPGETPDPGATEPPTGSEEVRYPAGTVALADVSGAHGSQFLIFHEDYTAEGPIWPLLGTVTSGLDLVEAIGAAGPDGDDLPAPPDSEVRIESLTVSGPVDSSPAGGESPDPSPGGASDES